MRGTGEAARLMAKHPKSLKTPVPDTETREQGPQKLGDLLYRGTSKVVPESEWLSLVQAVATGDQTALRALYERSHRIAFTLIMRITNNRQTSEELTLDVYYEVWQRAAQYDAVNGPVLGWILNQARSRAIDRLRHDRRRKRVNPYPHDSSLPAQSDGNPDALGHAERSRQVRDAVATLNDDERTAIEAAFFSELSHAEVAARLNQPLGTVKSRIRSGLRKLRQHLAADKE
jgi:RNA polymerase sigma-70 factor, ECF subfamily